ncbi:hypothetical protein THICB3600103 [Thiomonas sp. CB3]|nr:hypothetical protein THICB3600103 [Thiomonas sp. CB3]
MCHAEWEIIPCRRRRAPRFSDKALQATRIAASDSEPPSGASRKSHLGKMSHERRRNRTSHHRPRGAAL